MRLILNLLAGVLFGFGLVLSGMIDPAKVLNFLDIAGSWDPSLAFVMAGAIAVTAPGYLLAQRRAAPLLEAKFEVPATTPVTRPLVVGSGIFGLGWGLSGFCPGPALSSLVLGAPGTRVFVVAMLVGGLAGWLVLRRATPKI